MLDENYIRNNLHLLDADSNDDSEYDIESIYENLSESFIREFKDKVCWWAVSLYSQLSEDFIREFQDYVNWDVIFDEYELSEDFIREFADHDRVDFCDILDSQSISEEFIREFADRIDFYHISPCRILSEEFIREFADRVDWYAISNHQVLSEEFIREFADRVDWYAISNHQVLSEEFIREFKNEINLACILHDEISFFFYKHGNHKDFTICTYQHNIPRFYSKKTFDDEKQLVHFAKEMFNDFSVSFSFKVNPIISIQYLDSPESEIVAYDLENINYDLLTRQF